MSFKLFSNVNHINFKQFRYIFSTNCSNKNHYDVLNLNKNCSQTEIRNSYLKLSKQYHPDKNQNQKDTHKDFVQISEAYNVLSKPSSRRDYDLGFHNSGIRRAKPGVWTDQTLWEQRDTSRDSYYESKPYYGVKGLKKIPNYWIVLLCIGLTTIGVIFQYIAIRKSFTLRREDMEKRSLELEKLHSEIRAQAIKNGDQKQLEILIKKLNRKDHT